MIINMLKIKINNLEIFIQLNLKYLMIIIENKINLLTNINIIMIKNQQIRV